MSKVPFAPPRMDEKIVNEVVDALYSGWITTGPRTKKFEEMLEQYTGAQNVVCLNSATAGMELALRWFGVGPGDEVIVPVYTYCATGNVVLHCGAKVVFCDIQDDFNIDVKQLEGLITENTKVIMPVDIGGMPVDYVAINEMVRRPDIKAKFSGNTEIQKQLGRILILADAAHSVGAKYQGKMSGVLADMSTFSFHAVKNLVTAEGGCVCLNLPEPFNNQDIYTALKRTSLHGQSKDALAKTKVGGWRYDILEPGYKCNMTDLAAAIGLIELERYDDDMLVRRKSIFDQYSSLLNQYSWANIPVYQTDEKTSSYHIYMLRINGISEEQRDLIMNEIAAQEVAVNVHFQPLPMLTAYKNLGYSIDNYPNGFKQYSCEITLPVFYDITSDQIQLVVDTVSNAYDKVMG
ncbi:MAG: DegT/DnrJ/EryC1/StrS family aminotransferase [Salibacteraceae bacterium]